MLTAALLAAGLLRQPWEQDALSTHKLGGREQIYSNPLYLHSAPINIPCIEPPNAPRNPHASAQQQHTLSEQLRAAFAGEDCSRNGAPQPVSSASRQAVINSLEQPFHCGSAGVSSLRPATLVETRVKAGKDLDLCSNTGASERCSGDNLNPNHSGVAPGLRSGNAGAAAAREQPPLQHRPSRAAQLAVNVVLLLLLCGFLLLMGGLHWCMHQAPPPGAPQGRDPPGRGVLALSASSELPPSYFGAAAGYGGAISTAAADDGDLLSWERLAAQHGPAAVVVLGNFRQLAPAVTAEASGGDAVAAAMAQRPARPHYSALAEAAAEPDEGPVQPLLSHAAAHWASFHAAGKGALQAPSTRPLTEEPSARQDATTTEQQPATNVQPRLALEVEEGTPDHTLQPQLPRWSAPWQQRLWSFVTAVGRGTTAARVVSSGVPLTSGTAAHAPGPSQPPAAAAAPHQAAIQSSQMVSRGQQAPAPPPLQPPPQPQRLSHLLQAAAAAKSPPALRTPSSAAAEQAAMPLQPATGPLPQPKKARKKALAALPSRVDDGQPMLPQHDGVAAAAAPRAVAAGDGSWACAGLAKGPAAPGAWAGGGAVRRPSLNLLASNRLASMLRPLGDWKADFRPPTEADMDACRHGQAEGPGTYPTAMGGPSQSRLGRCRRCHRRPASSREPGHGGQLRQAAGGPQSTARCASGWPYLLRP